MPQVIYISGHLDLTEDEFNEHYKPQIDTAIEEGARFVVGDARGADTMAQAWLARALLFSRIDIRRVIVYHMFESPRNIKREFATRGGYRTDDERDAAMTRDSNQDLAWVRPGREKSGTAKNLARRNRRDPLDEAIAHRANEADVVHAIMDDCGIPSVDPRTGGSLPLANRVALALNQMERS